MATVPHSVPTRTAHAIAALYGVEDDTLVAWRAGRGAGATLGGPPRGTAAGGA